MYSVFLEVTIIRGLLGPVFITIDQVITAIHSAAVNLRPNVHVFVESQHEIQAANQTGYLNIYSDTTSSSRCIAARSIKLSISTDNKVQAG